MKNHNFGTRLKKFWAGSIILLVSLSINAQGDVDMIDLSKPRIKGEMSLEEVLYSRHSVRSYQDRAISLKELGQILWAGKGVNVDGVSGPTRTAPSAGGLYPQELYVAAGKVKGIESGIYSYHSDRHALELMQKGDFRRDLAEAALMQTFIAEAPASIIIAGVYERSTAKYGKRGETRYVHMDAAHSAQNVFLQVTASGLATVTVGAFNDEMVHQIIGSGRAIPLYIMPVGYPVE
ncbi:MAG: SagB/ThcOx family dehydrogenase [Spirochaetia bacterium]